jgi:hypothetical protein
LLGPSVIKVYFGILRSEREDSDTMRL